MTTNYPTSIDTYVTHLIGDTISQDYDNNQQDAIVALETKLGINNSADTNSIDYKLKSTSSVNPGHKHTLTATGFTDVDMTGLADGNLLQYSVSAGNKWIPATTSAPDASTTVKGVIKTSVAPVSATSPIAVGDNDTRVPTQDENDALAGTSGTPSSSNKYVTADDVSSAGASGKIVRASGTALPALDGSNLTKTGNLNLIRVAGYTPASNTTENTVFSTTITGGLLSSGGMIRVRIPITVAVDNNGSGNETYTIRLKYGGSTIHTTTIVSIKGAGGFGTGFVEAWIINNSATNSQNVGLYSFIGQTPINGAAYITANHANDTTSAIDTTSNQTLAMTVQRTDGTNSSMTFKQGLIETIYK